MRLRIIAMISFTVCMGTTFTGSLFGQVANVDWEIQQVYEHYSGKSLEQAIYELANVGLTPGELNGNVIVRCRGSQWDSGKLHIGQKNILAILVSNEVAISAVNLPLRFGCTAGSFSIDTGFGSVPSVGDGPLRFVKLHGDGFGLRTPWTPWASNISLDSDSILIGGTSYAPGLCDLPAHSLETILYTIQITVSESALPTKRGFWVDNINWNSGTDFDSAASELEAWQFVDASGNKFSPRFQWQLNRSLDDPSASRIYFDVVEPPCHGTSLYPSIKHLMSEFEPARLSEQEIEKHRSLLTSRTGERKLNLWLEYDGDITDLASIGVRHRKTQRSAGTISATFPLEMLPDVAQHPSVKRLYPGEPAGEN